ncbi:hypothetical protein DSM3645_10357 [Blastopirellula marina DSM 3645]|uniref:Uncharacterized protein n=1 Tax=Blastopirellula marina DSM 3645 TaxID=314230 RepID=A3ZM12_9BACT|nr:hypothetical protein DSM3645_10357 [Blastopirellula marina DSM 3645]
MIQDSQVRDFFGQFHTGCQSDMFVPPFPMHLTIEQETQR